ncbi:MAG: hypothetical protein QHJ82_11640, partial [Verrucomicrobiota bacterium]|nr:hypothetical protein [Verrucomicrobiota bacterium]
MDDSGLSRTLRSPAQPQPRAVLTINLTCGSGRGWLGGKVAAGMKKGYWVLALLVVGGSKFILPLSAQPYTFTWDPGQMGFNWNDSGNWSGEPHCHPAMKRTVH